jgi:hypothetical protein
MSDTITRGISADLHSSSHAVSAQLPTSGSIDIQHAQGSGIVYLLLITPVWK